MNKKTVEINGTKFEVDMDSAKRIDTFKVGDNVKVLVRGYQSHEVYSGVILGFYNFKELPTIQVAYFDNTFGNEGLKFVNINSETKDYELLPSNSYEQDFDRDTVVGSLDRQIEEAQEKLKSVTAKKRWFMKYYGKIMNQ